MWRGCSIIAITLPQDTQVRLSREICQEPFTTSTVVFFLQQNFRYSENVFALAAEIVVLQWFNFNPPRHLVWFRTAPLARRHRIHNSTPLSFATGAWPTDILQPVPFLSQLLHFSVLWNPSYADLQHANKSQIFWDLVLLTSHLCLRFRIASSCLSQTLTFSLAITRAFVLLALPCTHLLLHPLAHPLLFPMFTF